MNDDSIIVPIAKLDDEQRIYGGWAYVCRMPDGTLVEDHSGDVVDTPEAWEALKRAFVRYALVSRSGDLMHEEADASDLVELWFSDPERRLVLGIPEGVLPDGVFVSFKARENPAGERLWQGVKAGSIRALSIVGEGTREQLGEDEDG